MNSTKPNFFFISKLILIGFILFQFGAKAQTKALYSAGKENYRVVAIKEGAERVESVSNTVEFIKSTTIYFPNAFTPDQDGVNDKFGAVGLNAEKYELKIFNRWGELLFESSNIEYKWDGTHQGSLVPDGVYVYTMYAREAATGKNISKSGTVTVLL
jgi:gliding motility-associated-like protein